jgi:SAM-dependent methyltransferase
MRAVDRLLQRWRVRMAAPYVRAGDRLLDIGCFDGALIAAVQSRVAHAVGIDPLIEPVADGKRTLLRGSIPGDQRLAPDSFDCVTMLATLEHADDPDALSRECFRLLRPGGRVVLTVPHPFVDHLVHALVRVGLSDPADLEGHHGFDVNTTPMVFARAGFRLLTRRVFELGLNRLYVFEKPGDRA